MNLDADLTVNVARHGELNLQGAISGSGRLVKEGEGRLQIADRPNTYGGGTVVNQGELFLMVANHALGTGPLTLNPDAVLFLERVDGTNPLILNGGEIYAGNGFGDSWKCAHRPERKRQSEGLHRFPSQQHQRRNQRDRRHHDRTREPRLRDPYQGTGCVDAPVT